MSKFFEDIATETLDLRTAEVKVGEHAFTIKELTPAEMAKCVDEFGKVDFLAVIYRSVYDPDGRRMTEDQANRLPADIMKQFIEAYNKFVDIKKKTKN